MRPGSRGRLAGTSKGVKRRRGVNRRRRSNRYGRHRDREASRGLPGTDDEEDADEHEDQPGAEDHKTGGAQPVELAEEQGTPHKRGDYVQRRPRPARPCQPDVLRRPKRGVVAGGPDDAARKGQPERLPPEREMAATDDQRDPRRTPCWRASRRRSESAEGLRARSGRPVSIAPKPAPSTARAGRSRPRGRWVAPPGATELGHRAPRRCRVWSPRAHNLAACHVVALCRARASISGPIRAPRRAPSRRCYDRPQGWPSRAFHGPIRPTTARSRALGPLELARATGPLRDPHRAERLR